MTEELNLILNGKGVCIKNNTYFSAKDYITPFLKRLESYNPEYKCLVKLSEQNSITNGIIDTVYNKVCIQAILPESFYINGIYKKAICFSYGLDCKVPIAKFYIGDYNTENDNLIVTSIENLRIQKIEPSTALSYNPVECLLQSHDFNKEMLSQISKVTIPRDRLTSLLGKWINFTIDDYLLNESGKIKLAASCPIDAFKSLIKDKDSDFYIESNNDITLNDIYQSLLHQITIDEKDIINRFEKTMMINKMLQL